MGVADRCGGQSDEDHCNAIVNKLRARLSSSPPAPLPTEMPNICEWRYDGREDDYWTTTCGLDWCLEAGTPKENGYRYCPQCGKPIVFIEPTDDYVAEEDEAPSTEAKT
jgi:hypothetical protein